MNDLYFYGTWLTVIFWGIWLVSGSRSSFYVQGENLKHLSLDLLLHQAIIVFAVFVNILVVPANLGGFLLFHHIAVLNIIGFICVIAGLSLALWSRMYSDRYSKEQVKSSVGQQIIQSGPYYLIRHPIFTGILVGILGMFLLRPQVIGLIGFVLVAISYIYQARQEEKLLVTHYDGEYQRYQKRTYCLLPWIF